MAFDLFEWFNSPSPHKIVTSGADALKFVSESPTLMFFLKASDAMQFLKWFIISLDGAMPLVYLLVLTTIVRLNERTNELEKELEQVI